jgi:hypothetical protein
VYLREAQILLLEKFARLYDGGVPLAEALEIVGGELQPPFGDVVEEIVRALYGGSTLADAMARHADVFGPEIVGLIRSGEQRGELGQAARAAAAGLGERVLDPVAPPRLDLDALLLRTGDAGFAHVTPEGRLLLRIGDAPLEDAGEIDARATAGALARAAGLEGGTGAGCFLWQDRVLRVAVAPTPRGPATVVGISRPPGPEPAAAADWRAAAPGLLLVAGSRHDDYDGCLRSILAGFAPTVKRVAVGLPCPEAIEVRSVEEALRQDPDVICLARVVDARPVEVALALGVHVLAATPTPAALAHLPATVVAPA